MLIFKVISRFLIAGILYLISGYAMAFNANKSFTLDLVSGYGYLVGQEITLQTIRKKHPDLIKDVYFAETRFNTKFPNLKDKHFKVIESLNKPEVNRAIKESTRQLQAQISRYNPSKTEAIDFINEVNQRANGEIRSPFLENFLVIQYYNKPHQEMLEGFENTFSSQGMVKAKGVNVILKTPKSWQEQEASRPNIVKKWISQNGTGLDSIMLLVKDIPISGISYSDIEKLYHTGEIFDYAPDGMTILDKGAPVFLDRLPGYWIQIDGSIKRLDTNVYANQISYNIFYKNKIISIQCGVHSNMEEIMQSKVRAEALKPLCKYVANSLVIQNQWH